MGINFNDLQNNSIVLTGFQFIEQNPLGFFDFDEPMDREKVFEKKVEDFQASGKLVVKSHGFKPIKDENGKNKANNDIFIITRAKSRPVLIFQNIEFSKKYHDNVFIIPIQTLKKPESIEFNSQEKYLNKLNIYNKILQKNTEVYDMYYIPKKMKDGHIWDRVLKLSDARFVHKSTLYGNIKENEISPDDINEIGIRLSKMINIKEIEKCDECIYNYENYKDIQEKGIKNGNI